MVQRDVSVTLGMLVRVPRFRVMLVRALAPCITLKIPWGKPHAGSSPAPGNELAALAVSTRTAIVSELYLNLAVLRRAHSLREILVAHDRVPQKDRGRQVPE